MTERANKLSLFLILVRTRLIANGNNMKITYRQQLETKLASLVKNWNPEAKVYAVGGYVRDEILKERMKDIDLVIDLPGESNPAVAFVDYLKASHIPDCSGFTVYPRFGTAKFDLSVGHCVEPIECVMPRKEHYADGPRKPSGVEKTTIEEDATRRDFCCNALYKDLQTGEILDPTGRGLNDLKNKILDTPLDPKETFKDDPLRMLRAIRFSATKGFTVSERVMSEIKPIPEYYQLSMERIRDEFEKIISKSLVSPSRYIWILHDTGLLKNIIPELEESWGFNQNSKYHSMNLTDHTLAVLDNFHANHGRVNGLGRAVVSMAALLHDISKYKIHAQKPDGTFSYHGHEVESAKMAVDILRRLKYSEAFISDVKVVIENHMMMKSMYNYSTGKYTGSPKSTRKIIAKFKSDDLLDDALALIDADNLSHAPEWCMPGQVQGFYDAMIAMHVPSLSATTLIAPVSGDDIMKRYGLNPGKQIGKIKDVMQELYLGKPDISEDDLFVMYEAEFKDRGFWVWGEYGRCFASIPQPKTKSYGNTPHIECDDYRDAMELDSEEEWMVPESGMKFYSAIEYPDIYIRCRTHKNSRILVDKILDLMEEFHSMPGFKNVEVSLDCSNDASGFVEWHNHKTDYIL